jgi:hypothetical protein
VFPPTVITFITPLAGTSKRIVLSTRREKLMDVSMFFDAKDEPLGHIQKRAN